MDWPFVGSGLGQGFGLVKRSGVFFVAASPHGRSSWGPSCEAHREVSQHGLGEASEFSVVLDLERGRVLFLADGCEIPGSGLEIARPDRGRRYRFIASVPPGGGSVAFVGDPRLAAILDELSFDFAPSGVK